MPQSGIVLFAYRRISPTELEGNTKEERELSATHRLALQTNKIEKYVAENYPLDTQLVWFEDKLITGTKMDKRIGVQTLLAELDSRKPHGIIFTKIARFFRSTKDMLNTTDICKAKGIAIISTDEKIDTESAQGYLFFTILAAFAQFEADIIKERTTAGKIVKQEEMEAEGRNWGRPRYVVKNKLTGEKFQLTENDIDNIKKLNSIGVSIQRIADQYHISTKPIWNILKDKYKKLNHDALGSH